MKHIIYQIKCLLNNKLYIGITNNLKSRWNKHVYDTNHNSSCVIHNAMRKHGISNFEISVIEECADRSTLLEKEVVLISTLKTHVSQGGYNTSFGGDSPQLGRKLSQQTKNKISLKLIGRTSPNKGKTFSDEIKKKMRESHGKEVVQMNISNEIIATYKSITAASFATNIADSNISGVCRGKKKTAGGFKWKYKTQ